MQYSKKIKMLDTIRRIVMKKLLLLVVSMLLLGTLGFAAEDAVLGVHDLQMTYTGGGTPLNLGCRSCHVPHGGSIKGVSPAGYNTIYGGGANNPLTGQFLLWDKNLITFSYNTYNSPTMLDGATPIPNPTGGVTLTPPNDTTDPQMYSYLCLSCHDGTVASLNLSAPLDPLYYLTNGNTGLQLTNDHPINIDMGPLNHSLLNTLAPAYETPANVTAGTSSTVAVPNEVPLPLYTLDGGFGSTPSVIECSSCHNPHAQPNVPNGENGGLVVVLPVGVDGNFLRIKVYDGVTMCRTCHLDKR